MANKEKEEVKKKSTLVHDTICLFMITLISGLLLGAGGKEQTGSIRSCLSGSIL